MNASAYTNSSGLISLKTDGSDAFEMFIHTTAGYAPLSFGSDGGTFKQLRPSTDFSSSATNNWGMVTVVFDGVSASSTSSYAFYFNGNPIPLVASGGFSDVGNTSNLGSLTTSQYFFNGKLDDVRIYNYALGADQVKQLYIGGGGMYFGPVTGTP
jgi:hypothetical protein